MEVTVRLLWGLFGRVETSAHIDRLRSPPNTMLLHGAERGVLFQQLMIPAIITQGIQQVIPTHLSNGGGLRLRAFITLEEEAGVIEALDERGALA